AQATVRVRWNGERRPQLLRGLGVPRWPRSFVRRRILDYSRKHSSQVTRWPSRERGSDEGDADTGILRSVTLRPNALTRPGFAGPPSPTSWERECAAPLPSRRIIRALAGDRHIVHMAFAQARVGDAHEAGAA